jgi:hypothetical protein
LYVAGAIENDSISGVASLIVMSSLYALLEPPEFEATIVIFVVATTFSGVPEIFPVAISNTRPVGTAGLTEKLVGTPPEVVGVFVTTPTPFT